MDVNPTLKGILPNISDEQVKAINQTLADIGVESTEDLKEVREDDIVHILKPIQARKLIKFWQNAQALASPSCEASVTVTVGSVGSGSNVAGRDISFTTNYVNTQEKSPTQEEALQLEKKLKDDLRSEINQLTGSLDVVPLELTDHTSVVKEQFGNGFGDYSRMEQQRKQESSTYEPTQLFDEASKQNQNFVCVIGEPGIGKSFLVKTMLKHFVAANDESGGPFVFLLLFRRMDFKSDITVFQFLVNSLLPNLSLSEKEEEMMLNKLNDMTNVYIFADGLDEASDELFTNDIKDVRLHGRAKPDMIVKALFGGKILRNSKKLVTSRPDAFLDLFPTCKPTFTVRILGLDEKAQNDLCRKICCGNEKEYRKVKERLDANPDMQGLCYVPLYCDIIIRRLRNFPEGDKSLRVTLTWIFVESFYTFVKSCDQHFRGKTQSLLHVLKLALDGVKDDRFMFSISEMPESDLESFNNFLHVQALRPHFCDSFDKILSGEKKYFFVHLLWQELLAAIELMFFTASEEFECIFKELRKPRWKAVLRFAFGLQNENVKMLIHSIFPRNMKKNSQEFMEKCCKLKALVKFSIHEKNYLDPCIWAFEAGEKSLTEEVYQNFPQTFQLPKINFPSDAVAIAFILTSNSESSKHKRNLKMTRPKQFRGRSLEYILDAANIVGHKVKDIDIEESDISAKASVSLRNNIRNIHCISFRRCTFGPAALKGISDAIQGRPQKVGNLSFAGCMFTRDEETALTCAMWNVKALWLRNCRGHKDYDEVIIPSYEDHEKSRCQNTDQGELFLERLDQVPSLNKKYSHWLETGKWDEANQTLVRITCLITEEINAAGSDLQSLGDLVRRKDCHEAILLYFASASSWKSVGTLRGMKACVEKLWEVNKTMVERSHRAKGLVKYHVIPLMHDIKEDMLLVPEKNKEEKCEFEVKAFHCIAKSYIMVDEQSTAEEIYNECLARIKEFFGNEADKRQVTGLTLLALGDLHMEIRVDDAISYYNRAVDAYKYSVEDTGRSFGIKVCKLKIERAQKSRFESK